MQSTYSGPDSCGTSSREVFERVTIIFYNADTATEEEATMCVVGGWGLGRKKGMETCGWLYQYCQILRSSSNAPTHHYTLLKFCCHNSDSCLQAEYPITHWAPELSCFSPFDLYSWISLCWPGHSPLLSETS